MAGSVWCRHRTLRTRGRCRLRASRVRIRGVSARGRRGLASYGVTVAGQSVGQLVRVGVVLGLVVSIPTQILFLVHEYVPLGPDTPFWELQKQVPWDLGYWVYLAVGSFLLVPVVEEFVSRGYALGRLRECSSTGGAILVAAVMFAFAHGQYHELNILKTGSLLSLVFGSICWGYAVCRTGSLVPVIVAHMIVNLPATLPFQWGVLGLSLVILGVAWRPVVRWACDLWRALRAIDDLTEVVMVSLLVVIVLLTLRSTAWSVLAWVGICGILFLFVSLPARYGAPASAGSSPRM